MGDPVPNEVFMRTRAGLCAMVSSRAAERILLGALQGSGHSPENIDRRQMRRALLGPVLHELQTVLPSRGLRKNLEELASSLRADGQLSEAQETPRALLTGSIPPPVANGTTAEREPKPRPARKGTATDSAAAPTADVGKLPTTPDADEVGAVHVAAPTSSAERNEVAEGAARFTARQLSPEELDRAVTRFARIENVTLVAAIRGDGSVAVSRGAGPDPALLARLSRLALNLLSRGGNLRSLHVGHTRGQLFLFPVGSDLLVVMGAVEVNLGAVTTAFTALALEEEI